MTWAGQHESSAISSSAALFSSETALDGNFLDSPVAVVDPRGLSAMGVHAEAQGYLWVQLAPPGPEYRGRLGLYIEESIEAELEQRGALAPGITASTGLDGSLSDQLYRARLINCRGLALGVPTLEGITNLGRTLDAEDSGVLRWWMASTSERPVRLILANENMRLRVYPSPVLFESLFEAAPEPVSPRAPSVAMAESAESMALSDLPPSVSEIEDTTGEVAAAMPDESAEDFGMNWGEDSSLPELDRALGLSSEESEDSDIFSDSSEVSAAEEALASSESESSPPANEAFPEEDSRESGSDETTHVDAFVEAMPEREHHSAPSSLAADDLDEESFFRQLEEDSARAPIVQAKAPEVVSLTPLVTKDLKQFIRFAESSEDSPVVEDVSSAVSESEVGAEEIRSSAPDEAVVAAPSVPEAPEVPELHVKDLRAALAAQKSVPGPIVRAKPSVDESDPFVQLARKEWRTWMTNLDAARGPKPLSVVERMFVTDYTRLREAVRLGVATEEATEILDAWQSSFQSSYSEAFDALRVRGKRPTMVLDLPEMAQRLARLQGARRVQLLLVDGMRFDLGLMVQDRLKTRVDAALTERLLLWSALPTTTTYQLELLGKGPEGLKEMGTSDESPALVARGRAALSPRRIRTGRVELMKLDVVEDCLREAGVPVSERLVEIADRTADAVTDHMSKQPPRTLVVVFGDHGFSLDPKSAGTTEEVRQGGSSPEEVLVPAFAWLTGAVH